MRKTVLIAEDNDVTRQGLAVLLCEAGYSVEMSANGRATLESLRAGFRPDLILLDMMMPEMDGWEFMHERLADESLANIPVVVITSLGVASQD